MESFGLEGTFEGHLVPLLAMNRDTARSGAQCPVPLTLGLGVSRGGAGMGMYEKSPMESPRAVTQCCCLSPKPTCMYSTTF